MTLAVTCEPENPPANSSRCKCTLLGPAQRTVQARKSRSPLRGLRYCLSSAKRLSSTTKLTGRPPISVPLDSHRIGRSGPAFRSASFDFVTPQEVQISFSAPCDGQFSIEEVQCSLPRCRLLAKPAGHESFARPTYFDGPHASRRVALRACSAANRITTLSSSR